MPMPHGRKPGGDYYEELMKERDYMLHRKRVANTRAAIDNSTPASCAYTRPIGDLRTAYEKEYKIKQENQKLVERMVHIMNTKGGIDNSEPWRHSNRKTDSQRRRNMEQERIDKENSKLLGRLQNTKSMYNSEKLDADRTRNETLAARISRYPYQPLDQSGPHNYE